jgi:3-oxoacyl-ACP reductase-like protein
MVIGECRIGIPKPREQTMSIFGSIVSAIFGHKSAPVAAAAPAAAAPSAAAPATPSGAAAPKALSQAEVVAVIEEAVGAQGEDLNWKQSIVDLMKALKLDSSLAARKQLAQELGYTGALDGSAEMNVWLHKQVMAKLAEGGGTVPASLKVA